jgi:hypothetical protein
MQLTLRKASAIQKLINEEINSTSLTTKVSIGRFDDPVKKRDEAITKTNDAITKKGALLNALYAIRNQVAAAGQAAGVGDILTQVALIEKLSGMLKPLAGIEAFVVDRETLAAQFKDLTEDKESKSRYSSDRRETFDTSTVYQLSADTWKENLGQFRKEKQALSDKLLELNVRTEITLDAATVETLKYYGIF